MANPENIAQDIHESCASGLPGVTWGVALETYRWGMGIAELNPDREFRAASLNKLAVTGALDIRNINLGDTLRLEPTDIRPGNGFLQYFPPGYELSVGEAARLALSHSDNTATRMLVRRLGGPNEVNEVLDSKTKLHVTRLEPINPADNDAEALWYYGKTTPHEAAELFRQALMHGRFAQALHHNGFNYGLRREVEKHLQPFDQASPPASLSLTVARRLHGHAPQRLYDRLLHAQWPRGKYPNKEGTLDDGEDNVYIRHDVGRFGKVIIAALSEGHSPDAAPGYRHPAYRVHAKLGAIAADVEY